MPTNPTLLNEERAKIVTVNLEIIQELLQNEQWDECLVVLKENFKIQRLPDGSIKKIIISEEVLHLFDKWLLLLSVKVQDSLDEIIGVTTAVLRSLRNCVSNSQSQTYIVEHTNILITCYSLFEKILEIDENSFCLKILLQFLINVISSNNSTTEKVYNIFFEKVKQTLKNNIFVYETSALIYNILLIVHVPDIELINIVFEKYNNDKDHNEYLSFFLEHTISKDYFWEEYVNLKIENRLTILEILRQVQVKRRSHTLPLTGLKILIQLFLNSLDVIFQVQQGKENDMRIYEISLILENISSLSSNEHYLLSLQNNKDLFINSGVLLINIHKLGKLSDNCFTPVQKLSEFTEKTELKNHPAFGFKADLIRIIGNLCWKNKDMQNLARTSELIPVILDCCNMDAKNPFILQWAVLAVRNLCENNLENQKFIASLHGEGLINSEILGEVGMTLHSDGENRVGIVPLDSLRKL